MLRKWRLRQKNCFLIKKTNILQNICSKSLTKFTGKARISYPEVSCKKGVLENFAILTGKHPCQSLFSNKVAGLNFITKESVAQVFSSRKVFKNNFVY